MAQYTNEQLKQFTKDLSDTEEAKAKHSIEMVEDAVKNYDWGAVGLKCPKICRKGSYNNGTNVKIDSDVDIYALFSGWYLVDTQNQCISERHHGDGHNYEYHRHYLEVALKNKFGDQMKIGHKAFKIKETSYKHEADVMGAILAKDDNNIENYNGIRTFFNDGSTCITYPIQDKKNSDYKDVLTGGYYKQMVRIFKGIKNDLDLDIPSFLIECMVYNIDNMYIMDSATDYLGKARNIVKMWDLYLPGQASKFVELNEIKLLFSHKQKWTVMDAVNFVNKMKEVLF